ncbi:MAG: nicotinate-nucleotide adenylyltransferase [Methylocystis sp.]|uniref:nicotinate-nucleotide adenylyltransferase n=1 Tax=Methylocystis sp. TaxID=1911079 RepID=UPI003D13B4A2
MSAAPIRLPPHAPGMRIGLFGGSFDPPHEGHALVSRLALKRLKLDRLWWIVSPGNPLKEARALPSIDARIEAAKEIMRDPRVAFTGFESEIGARYTCDTLDYLHAHCPGVRFVWIMGADNLLQFHRWRRWRDIARTTPIAVIDRPGATFKAANARAAVYFRDARLPESDAAMLPATPPPAIVYLHGPRLERSSTELRRERAPVF